MYYVTADWDPYDPSSDCVIVLCGKCDGKFKDVVKSVSRDIEKQGEAFELLELVAEMLNHSPSDEFRQLLLDSIGEICLANERRKEWKTSDEGSKWMKRLRSSRSEELDE